MRSVKDARTVLVYDVALDRVRAEIVATVNGQDRIRYTVIGFTGRARSSRRSPVWMSSSSWQPRRRPLPRYKRVAARP